MERGYGVIIAGAAIFVLGIVLTTVWALPLAEQLQSDTRILQQLTILAGNSVNIEFEVADAGRPLSVIVTPSGSIPMRAVITGPDGAEVLNSEFSETFANSADPATAGTYTLTVSNEGTEDATADIVFGHIPGVGEDTVNADTYGGVITGIGIIIAGVMVMVGGVVVWVSDRRRKDRQVQKGGYESPS
jgi:hypothetical protein